MINIKDTTVLPSEANRIQSRNSNETIVTAIPAEYITKKYLDKDGAQKLVTQFKAYVDSLVGSD